MCWRGLRNIQHTSQSDHQYTSNLRSGNLQISSKRCLESHLPLSKNRSQGEDLQLRSAVKHQTSNRKDQWYPTASPKQYWTPLCDAYRISTPFRISCGKC